MKMKWGISLFFLRGLLSALILVFQWAAIGEEPADGTPPDVTIQGLTWSKLPAGYLAKVQLDLKEGEILDLDFSGCEITKWTDDQGTGLGTRKAGESSSKAETCIFSSSGKGRSVEIGLFTRKTPSPDAAVMNIEGSFLILQGLKQNSAEQKDPNLQKGGKLDLGGFPFEVVESEQTGDHLAFTLEMATDKPFKKKFFKKLEFLDARGKKFEQSQWNATSLKKADGLTHHTWNYVLKGNLPVTALKWEMWTETAERRIPFKIETRKKSP